MTSGFARVDVDALRRQLIRIAEKPSKDEANACRVYILHVRPVRGSGHYKFYVGHTANTVEERFERHLNPTKRVRLASIFKDSPGKQDVYEPVSIASEFMTDFPEFATRSTAERAERALAKALTKQGFAAFSDKVAKSTKRKIEA